MAKDEILSEEEIENALSQLPGWKVSDGWLTKSYKTPGFSHTIMLVNTIGFVAEAAWHHPDLEVGYAKVKVKLQTHRVGGITASDTELATKIEEVVSWLPGEEDALDGFPKKWIS